MLRWIFAFVLSVGYWTAADAADRPNILWVTSEDNGPHLGCYGDAYATTPHIDALAAEGMIYLNAWSNAPVCAPARTTIISGMYPPTFGGEHMRSAVRLPAEVKLYPQHLRAAGYYCTNNVKEDYNLKQVGDVWDESSNKAHYKNRQPGQPFFAIFNFTTSHESQVRKRPHTPVHDPAKVRVPAYHPDVPEVRRDWAQYYDKLTEMDQQVGRVLQELDDAGLADDTIVFYYGDHGPGMPRSKRWPYNSGLHVPLVVRIPQKFRQLASDDYEPGAKSNRLVSFVDLAPTVLSLAGAPIPDNMQGIPFLGTKIGNDRDYVYGFRGRMDERIDMVRTMRDERYVYIRNFLPHRRYGEHVDYMFQTPTTQVWHRQFVEGKLNAEQARFWQTKPVEELYDLQSDPDEVHNLADLPEHRETLQRFREAMREFLVDSRDAGLLPEEMMHDLAGPTTIYELARDPERYPLRTILAEADAATGNEVPTPARIQKQMQHEVPGVRYWCVVGLNRHGENLVPQLQPQLLELQANDRSRSVRIVAAEALVRFGDDAARDAGLQTLLELSNVETEGAICAIMALNALDVLRDKAGAIKDKVAQLPVMHPSLASDVRMREAIANLVNHITAAP